MKKINHPAASLFILLLIFLVLYFFKLASFPIRIWDEARLANSALFMHLHGFSLAPRYEGSIDMWSTKPPLMIWLQALSMKIFGMNEWAVRFPSAASATLTGVITWRFFGKFSGNYWNGLIAGAVFASTFAWVYIHAGRTGDYDSLLTFFTCIYTLAAFLYTEQSSRKWLYTFWIALTLAVLTKGIAGILFVPGIIIYILMSGKTRRFLLNKQFYVGMAIFIFMVSAYYLLREQINPGYLKAVWQNELGGRYLTTLEEHQHPFKYYFENMYQWRYPYWVYFVLPAFISGIFNPSTSIRRLSFFNLSVTLTYLLVISNSGTKLEWYDLPVYPFFAIQIAILFLFFASLISPWVNNKQTRFLLALAALVTVFSIPFKNAYNEVYHFYERPWDVEQHRQGYFIKDALRKHKRLNDYVFLYDGYKGQIGFYITALQAGHVRVQLEDNITNVKKGDHLVASQDELKKQIESIPGAERMAESFGCTEYIIK
jgi:4-amino-4-deoxy-L-arabinose transferase-like glycosyltransferase